MRYAAILSFFLLLCLVQHAPAAEQAKEIKGYRGLYMGHSFFVPSAKALEKLAPDTNVVGHEQVIIGKGGAGGSPGKLWDDPQKRDAAQRQLDTKQIDLLVLTYYSPENSSVEHYSRWFDYAIAQNPKTVFMITIPWATHLHEADETRLKVFRLGTHLLHDALITPLRAKYPDSTILYCPYGLGTYELIDRLNAGKLPGVKHVAPADKRRERSETYLLTDQLGHPSELVARLGSILWLKTLYNTDLSTLNLKRMERLPDIDLQEIAAAVYKEIEPYNKSDEKP